MLQISLDPMSFGRFHLDRNSILSFVNCKEDKYNKAKWEETREEKKLTPQSSTQNVPFFKSKLEFSHLDSLVVWIFGRIGSLVLIAAFRFVSFCLLLLSCPSWLDFRLSLSDRRIVQNCRSCCPSVRQRLGNKWLWWRGMAAKIEIIGIFKQKPHIITLCTPAGDDTIMRGWLTINYYHDISIASLCIFQTWWFAIGKRRVGVMIWSTLVIFFVAKQRARAAGAFTHSVLLWW